MKYEYINISKCGNWVQPKEYLYVYYIYGEEIQRVCAGNFTSIENSSEFNHADTRLKNKEIDEIKHYIMNREVFAK